MKTILQLLLTSMVLFSARQAMAQPLSTPVQTNSPPGMATNMYPMSADVTMFFDSLTPYGDWFWIDPYGWVWSPHVAVGWRPYTEGSWAYSDSGWTWVSDVPWGWAPFHYGRWWFHEHRGWCWAPDRVWGPAWVSWHFGDAWCGWAPLPPRVEWETARNWDAIIPAFEWSFTSREDFWRPHLHEHIVIAARNVTLLNETRNVTRFDLRDGRVFNASITAEQIEHFTGRPAHRVKLVDVNSVAATRGGAWDELRIFRPALKASTAVMASRPSPAIVQRGTPSALTFDELRHQEAERARLEVAHQTQREALERLHEREIQQPPRGISPGELQQRHEAEHRAFNEQLSREHQLLGNHPPSQPPPNHPAPPPMHATAGRHRER